MKLNCSFPSAVNYTWIFNNDKIVNTQNLTISYEEPSDSINSGTYICKFENDSNEAFNTSVFLAFESYFTLSPESLLTKSGDTITLVTVIGLIFLSTTFP